MHATLGENPAQAPTLKAIRPTVTSIALRGTKVLEIPGGVAAQHHLQTMSPSGGVQAARLSMPHSYCRPAHDEEKK